MSGLEKGSLVAGTDIRQSRAAGLPEAIEAASIERHRNSAGFNPASYRGRGVEWVRPTDLIARGSSRVAGAGINFQTELRRRTFELTAASARSIAERARHLPPLSAFGHGSSRHGVERGAIGIP